jgi:transposase-like protein
MQETINRYSEAYKIQVVNELESGKLMNIPHAKLKYGIKGNETIQRWLIKYGRGHLLPRRVRIEMPDEQSEIRKYKKRIRELEKALADTKISEVLNKAYFELVCEEANIKDIEGYKKKIAQRLSNEGKN